MDLERKENFFLFSVQNGNDQFPLLNEITWLPPNANIMIIIDKAKNSFQKFSVFSFLFSCASLQCQVFGSNHHANQTTNDKTHRQPINS